MSAMLKRAAVAIHGGASPLLIYPGSKSLQSTTRASMVEHMSFEKPD